MKKKSLNSKLVLNKKTITNLNLSNVKGGVNTTNCLDSIVNISCMQVCIFTEGEECQSITIH
ncbi:MAG: hypothetical protein GQ564_24005 [Bacteroidales bacterium]|nr:hypothetical protein [Bacteroidales bacterium]